MKRYVGQVFNDVALLEDDEFAHLKVMRAKVGDEAVIINGDGNEYFCQLKKIEKNCATFDVKTVKKCDKTPKKTISLYMAATKREKLELIVQKAVELGVNAVYLFESKFSTMKLSGERLDRYNKIILSATKQCERAEFMKIDIMSFDEMLEKFSAHQISLFANEREGEEYNFNNLKKASDIGVLVGCEGGFSADEKSRILKLNPENISLGERILRAETAAIVLCGIVSLASDN